MNTPTGSAVPGDAERVARAIDPAWWAWADVHYDEKLGLDAEQRQSQMARAERAIAALSPTPRMSGDTIGLDAAIKRIEAMSRDLRGHGEYRRGLAVALGEIKLALAARVAPAPVGVRALEWRENPLMNWVAPSIVGQYFVFKDAGDSTWALAIPDVVAAGEFETAEAAKAAAQSDFETRVRSALTAGEPALPGGDGAKR